MAAGSGRHVGAAITAGAIGGLVAAWCKLGWDVMWAPRPADRLPEPILLVSMFTHVPAPLWLSLAIHLAFGIVAGIAYALLVKRFAFVATGAGIGFGIAVWIATHEIAMPWLGLTPPAWQLPSNEQWSEFFGHAVWGFVIGAIYQAVWARFVRVDRSVDTGASLQPPPLPESIAVYHT